MLGLIKKLLIAVTFIYLFAGCGNPGEKKGLIGIYYSEPNLTSIKALTILETLEQTWDEAVDFQGESSGEWRGYIKAPLSGVVTFYLETDQLAELRIGRNTLTADKGNPSVQTGIEMISRRSYPITMTFWHVGKKWDTGSFSVKWSWSGQDKQSVSEEYLFYTQEQSAELEFLREVDPSMIDKNAFIYPAVENVIVYYEEGHFAGWPANNGIWHWGDEILVGFLQGYNKENKYHHAIDNNKPSKRVFSRSRDGGQSWTLENAPANFQSTENAKLFDGSIDFGASGFALKNRDNYFWFSYDKGADWLGPFLYPDLGLGEMTSRTDYIVSGKDESFIFGSVKDQGVRASLQDRAICIKTSDAGKSFEFVGWMSETDMIRSVMPATVRISERHFVSAMRRRLDPAKNDKYGLPENWIDVYESTDTGKSWRFLSKIANTDHGVRNGNPPSMVKTADGLLAVIYGFRGVPYSIRARISRDNGKTWSKEIILRDDARIWDIGYLRSVVRTDGKVVSVYYFSTKQHPERHIAATIWDPQEVDF